MTQIFNFINKCIKCVLYFIIVSFILLIALCCYFRYQYNNAIDKNIKMELTIRELKNQIDTIELRMQIKNNENKWKNTEQLISLLKNLKKENESLKIENESLIKNLKKENESLKRENESLKINYNVTQEQLKETKSVLETTKSVLETTKIKLYTLMASNFKKNDNSVNISYKQNKNYNTKKDQHIFENNVSDIRLCDYKLKRL